MYHFVDTIPCLLEHGDANLSTSTSHFQCLGHPVGDIRQVLFDYISIWSLDPRYMAYEAAKEEAEDRAEKAEQKVSITLEEKKKTVGQMK